MIMASKHSQLERYTPLFYDIRNSPSVTEEELEPPKGALNLLDKNEEKDDWKQLDPRINLLEETDTRREIDPKIYIPSHNLNRVDPIYKIEEERRKRRGILI